MNIVIKPLDKNSVKEAAAVEKDNLLSAWSETAIADCLENKNAIYLTASSNNKIIGICCFYHVADEVQLINLAVRKEFRGKGIGSALLSHMLNFAESKNVALASLEVETDNAAAVSLYKKHGFSISGKRKSFYPDGSDAFCMIKRLDFSNFERSQ